MDRVVGTVHEISMDGRDGTQTGGQYSRERVLKRWKKD